MKYYNPHLEYDIYHLGISGGKDSTATLLWAVYESGWPPDRLHPTFCDTGNEDPLTYAFIQHLNDTVFPIHTIKPERNFWELAIHKKRFPGAKARFCTQYLKIIPSMEYVAGLCGEGKSVLLLSGVRKEEGTPDNGRGELIPWYYNADYACMQHLPLYYHGMDDVWALHRRHLNLDDIIAMVERDEGLEHKAEIIKLIRLRDTPCNPLYPMGARRVGCWPCIFSRKREIRAIARYRPERIDFIRDMEEAVPGESTFFRRGTTPDRWATKEVTTKAGEDVLVPTIDNVVAWSHTSRGARKYEMWLPEAEPSICTFTGACE
jgi:3'-phosphoadenosine 5'-phosphosulfate sulfotransferase (PAPS reductase)/FAD synthetase